MAEAKNKNKDKMFSFRLTSEDAAKFEGKLAASQMKRSEFFREVFINSNVNLNLKSAPSQDLKHLIFIFNKTSNNLNQLAHKINAAHMEGRVPKNLYVSLNNHLVTIRDLLITELQNVDEV